MQAETWGIYLRLSKDDARGGRVSEANSIEGQRRACNGYVERSARRANIVEFAEEEYISASKGLDRPAYLRMLEAMGTGKLQHIVASVQDRFTRDRDVEFGELKRYARESGVQVHAADAGPMFDSPDREMASGIRAEFAAFEARLIGKRTRTGLQTRRSLGEWTSAGRTYGYLKGGKINPEQARHIRWAYDKILNDGWSARDVFDRWIAEDVRTVNDKAWTSVGRIMDMLRRPVIAGIVTYKGERTDIPAKWESIVAPDELDRMCAVLSANAKRTRGYGWRQPRRRVLAGRVLCGNPECTLKVMTTQNPGNARGYWYFHCDRRRAGCGNRERGSHVETMARAASIILLSQTEAPEVVGTWSDSTLKEIERQILDVRKALSARTMRASDAIPILDTLNVQLAEETRARDAHEQRRMDAASWHDVQYGQLVSGDLSGVPALVDNLQVLPDHCGLIVEGTNGVVLEIDGSLRDDPFTPDGLLAPEFTWQGEGRLRLAGWLATLITDDAVDSDHS